MTAFAPLLAALLQATAPSVLPAPESLVEQARLMEIVRALPEKRSSWAGDEHRVGLRAAEKLIAERLTALGYTPEFDPVDALGSRDRNADASEPTGVNGPTEQRPTPQPWNNIVVNIPGRTVPDQVLILSAHIDAVSSSPGADDDGTGVATVLEAARLLKDRPMQRTVRLVFFNLEEIGLVGSRAYTQRLKPRLDAGTEHIVGMASIDMIGFFSEAPGSQSNPLPAVPGLSPPTVGDFVGMGGIFKHRRFSRSLDAAMHAAEPANKTVVVDMFPIAPPDLMRSDHAPFLALGLPAVILTDTANFRNPNYHKPTDTVGTIEPERFTLAARAVIGAYHRLAGPVGESLPDLAPPVNAPPAALDPPATPPTK